MWQRLKTIIRELAKEACGMTVKNTQNKKMTWWTNEIKTEI